MCNCLDIIKDMDETYEYHVKRDRIDSYKIHFKENDNLNSTLKFIDKNIKKECDKKLIK